MARMHNGTTYLISNFGLVCSLACTQEPSCPSSQAPLVDTTNSGTANEHTSDPVYDWVELSSRNILDGAWSTLRFALDGGVKMEDANGAIEFALSNPELSALEQLVKEPSFTSFLLAQEQCPGTSHEVLSLNASTPQGVLTRSHFAHCLWRRGSGVNLGHISYAVEELVKFADHVSVSHLDCPHPSNLQDGILEDVPAGLNKLCAAVWQSLNDLEHSECQDEAIAEGMKDCY